MKKVGGECPEETNSWEEVEVNRLLNTLTNAPPLNQNREDVLLWIYDPSCSFSIRSPHNQWEIVSLPKPESLAIIWRNAGPLKMHCFGWLAYFGKIKKGVILRGVGCLDLQSNG